MAPIHKNGPLSLIGIKPADFILVMEPPDQLRVQVSEICMIFSINIPAMIHTGPKLIDLLF
jgi:hypothetical protein